MQINAPAQFYERAISDELMLRSEVRRLENLPTIEAIDDVPVRQAERTTPTITATRQP